MSAKTHTRRDFLKIVGKTAAVAAVVPTLVMLDENEADAATEKYTGYFKFADGGFYYFGPLTTAPAGIAFKAGSGSPKFTKNFRYTFSFERLSNGDKRMYAPYTRVG